MTRRAVVRWLSPLLVAGAMLAGGAWAQPSPELPDRDSLGGTLRVGLPEEFATLDPHMPSAGIDRNAMHAIYDPLVDVDERLGPKPGLAESWEIPDSLTYILHLRAGVKFHDGTDFDAEAVKWNIERILDPATGSQRASELAPIDEVVVIDPLTVEIRLKTPHPALFAVFADRVLPVSPTAAQLHGSDFGRNPVGTGAFRFVEWVAGSHVALERFDGYWGSDANGTQLPYLDRLEFSFLTDDTTRLTSVRTNDVDFVLNVPPKDAATIRADSTLRYDEFLGPGYNQIYFNTLRPPFDNAALRQALSYAIDRSIIHRVVYLGTGEVGESLIPPSHRYFDPNLEIYGATANLEMARQKLLEGGRPEGYEFNLEVFNAPLDLQLAELLKAQLEAVGIVANIVPQESSSLIQSLISRDYYTFRSSFVGRVDADVAFHPAFTCSGSSNYMNYCLAEVDDLLNQARASVDDGERMELYRQAQRLILNDAPLVILHFDALTNAMSSRVRGYVSIPDGIRRFKTVWLEQP